MDTKQQEELNKILNKIYKQVKPAVKEVNKRLTPYTPKNFGEKKTYPQDWPTYTRARSQEKLMFFKILKNAVDHLQIEEGYNGNGRPKVDYSDILKSLCIKSYHNYSQWSLESELKIAKAMGIINHVYKKSTLNKYMQDEKITKLLHKLYKLIAEPLADVELYFSIDATGISNAYGNVRWRSIRHTKQEKKKRREYSKLHILSGNKTNVICSAIVTKGAANDSPHLKKLLLDSVKKFNIREISADAGYLSKKNTKLIARVGAVPYIMGKKNINISSTGIITPWVGMLRLWKHHQMFFAEHYHQRSNIESTFSALKRKFNDFCRCKKPESQENEILCKIVCYNSCVLAEALLTYDLKGGFIDTL